MAFAEPFGLLFVFDTIVIASVQVGAPLLGSQPVKATTVKMVAYGLASPFLGKSGPIKEISLYGTQTRHFMQKRSFASKSICSTRSPHFGHSAT